MRILPMVAAGCMIVVGSWSCGSATLSPSSSSAAPSSPSDSGLPAPRPAADSKGIIAGFAFVDSSVTSQGSRAKLPTGTKIYPSGSTVTGTDGCPTNQYRTNGLPVVVIDYTGRPTAGSVTVTRHPASGGSFENAPYYLDVNEGRTIQMLGPIFDNGSYDVVFTYDFSLGKGQTTAAKFVLARSCGR